jgi:hypothetical protein
MVVYQVRGSSWHSDLLLRGGFTDDTAETAAGTSEASPWRRYVTLCGFVAEHGARRAVLVGR